MRCNWNPGPTSLLPEHPRRPEPEPEPESESAESTQIRCCLYMRVPRRFLRGPARAKTRRGHGPPWFQGGERAAKGRQAPQDGIHDPPSASASYLPLCCTAAPGRPASWLAAARERRQRRTRSVCLGVAEVARGRQAPHTEHRNNAKKRTAACIYRQIPCAWEQRYRQRPKGLPGSLHRTNLGPCRSGRWMQALLCYYVLCINRNPSSNTNSKASRAATPEPSWTLSVSWPAWSGHQQIRPLHPVSFSPSIPHPSLHQQLSTLLFACDLQQFSPVTARHSTQLQQLGAGVGPWPTPTAGSVSPRSTRMPIHEPMIPGDPI